MPDAIRGLLASRTPEEALEAPLESLAAAFEGSVQAAARFRETALAFDVDAELEWAHKLGARVLTQDDPEYPAPLRLIREAPLLLYAIGDLKAAPAAAAVVGSRRPTPYGRRMARSIAGDLAAAGVTVVSGLARGIDAEAHEGALARGRTWAVLGSGLGRVYPPENAPLARRIVDAGGCLLSEFPLGARPHPANFPRRNRVVAALGWATIVVEGRMRSGSRITAGMALSMERELFAVPGPADSPLSEAPHALLKQGAIPACGAQDVLDHLPPGVALSAAVSARRPAVQTASLSLEYRKILECVNVDVLTVEQLRARTGIELPRLSNILFEMELQGLVSPVPGQRYAKENREVRGR